MKFEQAAFSEPEKFEDEGKTVVSKTKITAANFRDPEVAEPKTREDELLEYYDPKKMGAGAESVVYETKDHEKVVVKISAQATREIVNDAAKKGLQVNEISEEMRQKIQRQMRENDERQKSLKQYFGSEHILASRASLQRVPVTKEMLDEILKQKLPYKVSSVWTIVTVQKRSRGLHESIPDDQTFSLTGWYSEISDERPEDYDEVTNAFVLRPSSSSSASVSPEAFAEVEKNQRLDELMQRASLDPLLRSTLQDFTSNAIAYSQATGEIIDIAGMHNVTLYQKNGKWNYELIDHLYPEKKLLEKSRAILASLKKDEEPTDSEKSSLLNTVNYVRFVNGLATFLDLPDRLQLFAKEKDAKVDFYQMLQGIE